MKPIKPLLILTSLILANSANSVNAASILLSQGPTVGDTSEFRNRALLSNSYFDRELYESVGIVNVIRQEPTDMLEAGEFWTMELIDNSTGQTILYSPVKYVAKESPLSATGEICIYRERNGFIDPLDPERQCALSYLGNGEWQNFAAFGLNWPLSCVKPGDYTVSTKHYQGTSEYPFELSDYVPGVPLFSIPEGAYLTPKTAFTELSWIKSDQYLAGDLELEINIFDSKNCGIPLEGIEVELENTIIGNSGGHEHGADKDPGTGKYITTTPVRQASSQSDSHITIITDETGVIKATYRAGIYGVDELMTVKVHVPNSDKVLEKEQKYSIKVPDLVPLATDGSAGYTVAGTGRECDSPHNLDKVGDRNSVYLTPYARTQVTQLNTLWVAKGNPRLSYNDASLPNGGYFDKGSFTVTEAEQFVKINRCHMGHRQGTGLDVNRGSSSLGHWESGNFIYDYTEVVTEFGTKQSSKKGLLRSVVIDLGGQVVPEGTLHYQFDL